MTTRTVCASRDNRERSRSRWWYFTGHVHTCHVSFIPTPRSMSHEMYHLEYGLGKLRMASHRITMQIHSALGIGISLGWQVLSPYDGGRSSPTFPAIKVQVGSCRCACIICCINYFLFSIRAVKSPNGDVTRNSQYMPSEHVCIRSLIASTQPDLLHVRTTRLQIQPRGAFSVSKFVNLRTRSC